ncbi:MAG: hypothetical protein GY906_22500 [bacterium]|nr:hypothetical protein [bacterium]
MATYVRDMQCADGYERADFGSLINGADGVAAKTAAYTIPDILDTAKAFSNEGSSGSVTFTLPAPKAGAYFTFFKIEPNNDLVLQAPAGVSIAGGSAAGAYQNATDETSNGEASLVLVGRSATAWAVFSEKGTWAAV